MKRWLSRALRPAARFLDGPVARLGRLWSHARFAARIESSLPTSTVVLGTPEVHGTGRVEVGANALLYPGLYLETHGEGRISIGEGVVLSRGVHIVARAPLRIEDGVMIGEYVSIRDGNHRVEPGQSVRYTGHEVAPIAIGANAWIGRGAMILPGVTIGAGAIVGANAVVTRDVEAGATAVGVPARRISR